MKGKHSIAVNFCQTPQQYNYQIRNYGHVKSFIHSSFLSNIHSSNSYWYSIKNQELNKEVTKNLKH